MIPYCIILVNPIREVEGGKEIQEGKAQRPRALITPSDGSRDVFVHLSAVERSGMSTLNEGQRVTYDIVTERGKQAAANLQKA